MSGAAEIWAVVIQAVCSSQQRAVVCSQKAGYSLQVCERQCVCVCVSVIHCMCWVNEGTVKRKKSLVKCEGGRGRPVSVIGRDKQ